MDTRLCPRQLDPIYSLVALVCRGHRYATASHKATARRRKHGSVQVGPLAHFHTRSCGPSQPQLGLYYSPHSTLQHDARALGFQGPSLRATIRSSTPHPPFSPRAWNRPLRGALVAAAACEALAPTNAYKCFLSPPPSRALQADSRMARTLGDDTAASALRLPSTGSAVGRDAPGVPSRSMVASAWHEAW